jgi:3-methyladenine DNA glycosylase AlkD
MRKQLKTLNSREFIGDVKQFIRSSHDFYKDKNPEIKVLANRLHEEYILKDFYKVFNRLWKSGYHNERVMAIYALRMYKGDYDKGTWEFLIPRLKEIRDFDEAERIGRIIGYIMVKYPKLKKEIIKINSRRNVYYRRIALASCFPLIKEKDWEFIFGLISSRLDDKEENIQELNGWILLEISKKNKTIVKRFVLKNIRMPKIVFDIVSSEMKELRKVRKLKKLDSGKVRGLGWLRMVG